MDRKLTPQTPRPEETPPLAGVKPQETQGKGSDFKILTATYELIKETYVTIRQYPKAEKYGLALDTKQAAYELLALMIRANKRYFKKTTLQDADIELDKLRHLFRMAYDLKFLAPRRYEIMAKHCDYVGRLLGGWIKSQGA